MATPRTLIKESLDYYPTLYGWSKLRVLNHLLVTNGNGMDWNGKGELVPTCKKSVKHKIAYLEKTKRNAKQMIKSGKKLFEMSLPVEESILLQDLARPISFYKLDLGLYSALGHLPSNITDAWLEVAALTLINILHYRENPRLVYYKDPTTGQFISEKEDYNTGNHCNALILINRYENMFGARMAWRNVIDHLEVLAPYYKDAKFWEIRERREKRLLELSCKCHLKVPKDDITEDPENLLTSQEYLDYFEIDTTGFENDLTLLRTFHAKSWKERYEKLKKRNEAYKKDDVCIW